MYVCRCVCRCILRATHIGNTKANKHESNVLNQAHVPRPPNSDHSAVGHQQVAVAGRVEAAPNASVRGSESGSVSGSSLFVCKVCLTERLEMIFMDCGHLVTCSSCAQRCERCPMCRAPIRAVMRVSS